jgi:hypothetical protein
MPTSFWRPAGLVASLILAGFMLVPAVAQQSKPGGAPETEAEKQEREGRRKCAAQLCSTLHNKSPAEGQVACTVQKTWRKDVLSNILSRAKVSWPWGDTRCASELKLDRAALIKAMQEPDFEAQFDTYDIRCQIDAANEKNPGEKYDVTAQIKPKVTFKDGKAVKANLNWGKLDAPTLAKSALWSVTAADNTFGLLQSIAVEEINEFITTKCMEVKDEWQRK